MTESAVRTEFSGSVHFDPRFVLTTGSIVLHDKAVVNISTLSVTGSKEGRASPITCSYQTTGPQPLLRANPYYAGTGIWHIPPTDAFNCSIDMSNVQKLVHTVPQPFAQNVFGINCGRSYRGAFPSDRMECISGFPASYDIRTAAGTQLAREKAIPLFGVGPPLRDTYPNHHRFNSSDPYIFVEYESSTAAVIAYTTNCTSLPSPFECYPNGTIISEGDVQVPAITITGGSGVIQVVGNLSTSLVLTGSGPLIQVSGCANISSLTIYTTSITNPTTRPVLTQGGGNQCAPLSAIPVRVISDDKGCKKANAKTSTSNGNAQLNVVFTIDKTKCNVKFIIIGSVLGALLIALISLILLFTFNKKARNCVRPYSKRKHTSSKSQ